MQRREIERRAVECELALERMGVTVTLTHDFQWAASEFAKIEKIVGPATNPQHLLLTQRNALWVLIHRDDDMMAGWGVRMDDCGAEDAQSFLARSVEVAFGRRVIGAKHDVFANQTWGKAAYFGDLKARMSDGLSPDGQAIIQMALAYVHHRVFADFGTETSYCFLRKSDARRAITYGFLEIEPFVWKTDETIYPDGNPEYVAILRRDRLPSYLVMLSDLVHKRFAENDQAIPTIVAGNATGRPLKRKTNLG